MWGNLQKLFSHVPLLYLQSWDVRIAPGFINGFECDHCWVISPLVEQISRHLDRIVDIGPVDAAVLASGSVPSAHPASVQVVPVVEGVVVDPHHISCLSTVVLAVLGVLQPMHVQQHLEVLLVGGVQQPLHSLVRSSSAANLRAVGGERPVTQREPE